jgi:hypothetical protein
MTSAELAEIERLASQATPGPWRYDDGVTDGETGERGKPRFVEVIDKRYGHVLIADPDCDEMLPGTEIDANGRFIAAARSGVPALFAEVLWLTALADAALAVRAARHGLLRALERLADHGGDDASLNAATASAAAVSNEAQRRLDMLLDAYEAQKREAKGGANAHAT